VLKRRAPRIALTGFLLAVAVSGLTACRTSPSVAAYVDDEQVSVDELGAAVDQRVADKGVAAYAEANGADFTRRVLSLLVQEEIYAVVAERYDVQVTDAQVRTRIDELLGEDDPDTVYSTLAQQGISRQDVFENVRQQLLRREIALEQGKVQEPSEAELRARYEETRTSLAQVRFGYITVPDQAAADALVAQLQAAPGRYEAAAAQFAGPTTLATLEERTIDQVPAPLAERIGTARPNTAFSVAVPDVGLIVTFVEGVVYPTFEEQRPQLEQEFTDASDAAGNALVDEVRADLDVVINPRYGVLGDTGELVPGDSGVVDILGDQDPAAAAPGGAGN
jgi:peptidyl-prolyl cis-trans isomerase SurA